jgi:hypothetical protein
MKTALFPSGLSGWEQNQKRKSLGIAFQPPNKKGRLFFVNGVLKFSLKS